MRNCDGVHPQAHACSHWSLATKVSAWQLCQVCTVVYADMLNSMYFTLWPVHRSIKSGFMQAQHCRLESVLQEALGYPNV